ncbi:MAG: NAD(P)(+) transhydrogenase (Re/Si-specific) subunit beta [Actinobacteria bacterium]|nr:NAD(P)(+) transhydrogenase (Re/Si-specific) subunit beta [Actinomycetota bacterium]
MTRGDAISLAYLAAIVAFILALRFLSSPARARLGNWLGALGMAIAIAATFAHPGLSNEVWILLVMAVSAPIGAYGARAVKMTDIPQMVALFNGVGGGAAALIALAEFHERAPESGRLAANVGISIVLSALIGAVSFAGSMVAFAKLQDLLSGRPIVYPQQKVGNAALVAALVAAAIVVLVGVEEQAIVGALILGALLFGVLFVLPIGGADMPVVISLLNACTGLAAAATGFVLHQNVLIVSGMLVGASGTLLTLLMARSMGRSVGNVLFGAFGQLQVTPDALAASADGHVRSTSAEDVAVMLAYAQRVIVVPGYGLAVAQAQHDVRKLADELQARGVDVRYAIHPVAGRMPGHMNVLLAEANVPYDELFEMEQINGDFPQTDVALVIGANDVTNPAARTQLGSPIYGMPILDVDRAKNVVVIKRSMNPGFAGIDNPLYRDPKTVMLFADAREGVAKLVEGVKAL